VTWADNALTTSPHTITMVDAADLPVNFAEAYICNWNKRILGVDGPCLRFMDAHGGVPPIRQVVEAGRERDSTLLGSSICLPPNGSASAHVTAGPGSTLHYTTLHVHHSSVHAGNNYSRRRQKGVNRRLSSDGANQRLASQARRRQPLRLIASWLQERHSFRVDSKVDRWVGSGTDQTPRVFLAPSGDEPSDSSLRVALGELR
jgi:hypothetical protein